MPATEQTTEPPPAPRSSLAQPLVSLSGIAMIVTLSTFVMLSDDAPTPVTGVRNMSRLFVLDQFLALMAMVMVVLGMERLVMLFLGFCHSMYETRLANGGLSASQTSDGALVGGGPRACISMPPAAFAYICTLFLENTTAAEKAAFATPPLSSNSGSDSDRQADGADAIVEGKRASADGDSARSAATTASFET